MEIGLSLGSNLGDRLSNLREARNRIAGIPGIGLVASSSVYETEPVDVPPAFADKSFLNAVIVIAYDFDVQTLHSRLVGIESDMGRQRGRERNAPRVIDVDILYAGQSRFEDARLVIPHPRWAERRFVVQPLAEIRPSLRLPGEARTVKDVLATLPAVPAAVCFVRDW
jgi:2-amino-4-hydroxy-6-hydroxymethyldihydropteridine diphosphokinase